MTDAVFAYPWNAPRPAIGGVEFTKSATGFHYLTPDGGRKWLPLQDLVDQDEKPDNAKYLRRRLAAMPHYIRRFYAQKLEKLDQKGKSAADAWLVNTFERYVLSRYDSVNDRYLPQGAFPAVLMPLRDQFWRLLWAGKKELKRLSHNLADIMGSEFVREFDFQMARLSDPHFATLSGYGRMGFLASHLNTSVPCWRAYCDETLEGETALSAVARLQSSTWWLNRLRRIHARWREHLMVATGYVQKKSAPYASDPCVHEWQAQKKANREYINAMELEDEVTGERISLADKVHGSIANPAIRRSELMVRMRGFEDLAKAAGLAGEFYTLTAPSRYHATLKDGRRNDKYTGASPRDTQHYLCKVWSKTRASWKRHGIRVFGFRVVEPHHDATPHWHLLLFMRPEHVEQVRGIFREYALAADGHEPGAQENRFKAVPIEEEHGSATGYIAKYISKNIDGYALDDEKDDETGEPLKEMARRVNAWSSRWAIRQFQQIGGAPVTVYRELRRLRDRELVLHPEIAEAHTAADEGNWAGYITAQGGPLVARDCLRVRLSYEVTENGNIYGDDVTTISGIYSPFKGESSLIFTRTTQYKIVPKRKEDEARGLDFDLPGGIAAPRSSVNNCTREPRTVEKQPAPLSMVGNDAASSSVDYSALSRKEKKAVAARLSNEFHEEERQKRERRKLIPARYQPGEQAERIRDFARSIGWDIGETEIGLLMAGQRIALDGVFYCARSDGALYRTREKIPQSTAETVNTLVTRLRSAYANKEGHS